eukprot:1889857-Amphidinium_carterae.1
MKIPCHDNIWLGVVGGPASSRDLAEGISQAVRTWAGVKQGELEHPKGTRVGLLKPELPVNEAISLVKALS